MATKLETRFFETFNISKDLPCKRCGAKNFALGQCMEVNCEPTYPEITDTRLLKLICYLSRYNLTLVPEYVCFKTIEALKEHILRCSMKFISSDSKPMLYVQDIQKIFEE